MNWAFASHSARVDASASVPHPSYPHRKLRHQQLPRWTVALGSLIETEGAVRVFSGITILTPPKPLNFRLPDYPSLTAKLTAL